MKIKNGDLLSIRKGYYEDMPPEYPDGAWIINASTLQSKFLLEGTPVLIIEKMHPEKDTLNWKVLVGDNLFIVDQYYLKDL